jgi:hypothetical protein
LAYCSSMPSSLSVGPFSVITFSSGCWSSTLTCWASLLPRQSWPKPDGPLCYLAKTCQNLLGLFATLPKLAKTCWASLLPRQNSPKLAGSLCYLAKTSQNSLCFLLPRQNLPKLAGLLCLPKLAKTCWASVLPRQNSPKLARPLCYLAKTRQNWLGLFATLPKLAKTCWASISPKLAKTCWASVLPCQNLPKLAWPLCYLAKTCQN